MPAGFFLCCSQPPYLRFALSKPRAILGRSHECDFVVDGVGVSRQHAEIAWDDDGVTVTDLDSKNGTFVENVRIRSERVRSDQAIRFGSVSFILRQGDESAENETDDPLQHVGSGAAQHAAVASLSSAQRRVFELLITGMPEKNISRRLDLSPHTVHNHVRRILGIFGVHSRAELLAALLNPKKE